MYALHHPEIYQLAYKGFSVAHAAVMFHEQVALYALDHPEIYQLAKTKETKLLAGTTVVHLAANKEQAAHKVLARPERYKLRDSRNETAVDIAKKTLLKANCVASKRCQDLGRCTKHNEIDKDEECRQSKICKAWSASPRRGNVWSLQTMTASSHSTARSGDSAAPAVANVLPAPTRTANSRRAARTAGGVRTTTAVASSDRSRPWASVGKCDTWAP